MPSAQNSLAAPASTSKRASKSRTASSTSLKSVLWAGLAAAAVASLPAVSAQHKASDNLTSLAGTWSSGSGAVTTGPSFANPVNYTFNVPETTGISFSFTEDGYFEEARYQFNANGSNPHCIQAYLLWQHGNYTLESNGSLTTQPIKADGRIQVQDPCAETTTVMTYYYEPGMYQSWAILNDVNHQQYMLQLYDYDGSLLQRMYLTYRPASMWPPGLQLTTNDTIKQYQQVNGNFSAAASVAPSWTLYSAVALAMLTWFSFAPALSRR